MIIVQITAGLGNQLFQYAAARAFSEEFKQKLKLDLSFFKTWKNPDVFRLDRFNTNYSIASQEEIDKYKRQNFSRKRYDIRLFNKIFKKKLYRNNKYHIDHKSFEFDKHKLEKNTNIYLSGYWANEKYFKEKSPIIRNEFTLKEELNQKNKEMKKRIESTNSVSIHIRRGDYVTNPYFANVPLSYYHKATNIIMNKLGGVTFFVFSDDINWVKNSLKIDPNCVYVDINNSYTDYMELILMASCKHNIIANSTFSWWGAWLNNNPEKIVIVPKIWFNNEDAQKKYERSDFIPKNWNKI